MTGIRLEVWDRPGTAGFGRRISTLDTAQDSASLQPVNGIGSGRASIVEKFDEVTGTPIDPTGKIIVSDPVDPSNNVRSLVRVYLDGQVSGVDIPYYEWMPDQVRPPSEAETGLYEISGFGREAMIGDAIVEPWDWNGEPEFDSDWPDWVYGGPDIVGPVEVTFSPHIVDIWHETGATGTFTIGVVLNGGATQTVTLTPGQDAFVVETAFEALAYGLTVDVQGTGDQTSPWRVTFMDPPGTYQIAISTTGLTGSAAFSTNQFGRYLPVNWTPSRVGTHRFEHGVLNNFRASLGGGGDPALPAGCSAWIIFDGQDWLFPGVQKRVRVQDNAPYYSPPIWLYAHGAPAEVRVVIRDLNENFIAAEEITLAASTVTQTVGIGQIFIPDGVHEIVYRIGHIGPGDPPPIYVGCPSLTEGFAPSTIGQILSDLYSDWTQDHVSSTFPLNYWQHGDGGHYLMLDFTTTHDSANNPWPRDESITIKRGRRGDKVMDDIARLGYEWRIIPTGITDGYWYLQVFAAGTMGTDYSALDSPTIRGGRDVTRLAVRRWTAKTGAMVEGAEQHFSHSASAQAQAAWGVSTEYVVERDFEPEAAAVAAYVKVDSQIRKTRSLVINISDIGQPYIPVPGWTYRPGDTVRVLDPPRFPDSAERVWSISYANDGLTLSWELQFGHHSWSGGGK